MASVPHVQLAARPVVPLSLLCCPECQAPDTQIEVLRAEWETPDVLLVDYICCRCERAFPGQVVDLPLREVA